MPADRVELEQRLAAMKPEHTVRGLFYRAVHQAVRLQAPAAEADRLASLVPPKLVDLFAYPGANYVRLLHEGADCLEPRFASFGDALSHLGQAVVRTFFDSAMGRTVKVAVMGRPRAVLVTLPMNYSVSTNWGQRTVRFTADRRAVVEFADEFIPAPVHAGVVEAGLTLFGAQRVRVVPMQSSLLAATLTVEWE